MLNDFSFSPQAKPVTDVQLHKKEYDPFYCFTHPYTVNPSQSPWLILN